MFSGCTGLTSITGSTVFANWSDLSGTYDIFKELFYNCTGLTNSSITATTLYPTISILGQGCFRGLFKGCSGITSLVSGLLPYTSLTPYCYYEMFYSTNVATPCTLPALILKQSCYQRMFFYCPISAANLPTLVRSGMALASYCYAEMFYGNTALASVPSGYLPGTGVALATYCYSQMFSGCSAMTTFSATLPHTTLVEGCYFGMFTSTRIVSPPALPATTLPAYCYYYMFAGDVTTSFTTPPVMGGTTGPTTIGVYSCAYMLQGCTSLTKVCKFTNVTSFDASACAYMYQTCTALGVYTASTTGYTTAWKLGTGTATGQSSSFTSMLLNILSGSTAPTTPVINTTYYVSGMV